MHLSGPLCAGANSTTPALCTRVLPSCISPTTAVALCQGATSLTPAYCGASLPTCKPNLAAIDYCRSTPSTPSRLHIRNITTEGVVLEPGVDFKVVLDLYDQFDQLRDWDNTTWVSVSLEEKGSNGARLLGHRSNTTLHGRAVLNTLSLNQPGLFVLHFLIDEVRVAAARVLVLPSAETQRRLACLPIFYEVLDWAQVGPSPPSPSATTMDMSGFVPFPISLEMANCVEVFQGSGFRAHFGWTGDLWVWYYPGKEFLFTRHLIR